MLLTSLFARPLPALKTRQALLAEEKRTQSEKSEVERCLFGRKGLTYKTNQKACNNEPGRDYHHIANHSKWSTRVYHNQGSGQHPVRLLKSWQ
jgi:hypothetical protein